MKKYETMAPAKPVIKFHFDNAGDFNSVLTSAHTFMSALCLLS